MSAFQKHSIRVTPATVKWFKKVRRAATGIHNKWRNYQAKGKVGIAPDFGRNYPTAADMLAMTYRLAAWKRKHASKICAKFVTELHLLTPIKNYDYISAKDSVTEEVAMILMIKGDTPTVGCHVKLCSTNGKNYAVLCYYGQP
ncbi:hypothetical protein OSTOST_19349 [Ostertagia ostertagi]